MWCLICSCSAHLSMWPTSQNVCSPLVKRFLSQTNIVYTGLVLYKIFYLQQKLVIEKKKSSTFDWFFLMATISTSQTLCRGLAGWLSATRCRPRWSSWVGWRGSAEPWRRRARPSTATTSPRPPKETRAAHALMQFRFADGEILCRVRLATCSSPGSASRTYCFLIE